MEVKGESLMKVEAINKFYLKDGELCEVKDFVDDNSDKGNIIYEVFRIEGGTPIFLKDHTERLKRSFSLLNLEMPFAIEEFRNNIAKVIKANDYVLGNMKMTYNILSKELKIFYIPHKYPSEKDYADGVKTILYHGERENPNIKIVNKSFRELINDELAKQDSYEAILVDRNGDITEGSRSNIFFIKDKKLITAPGKAVLLGVTRAKVMLIAEELNIEVIERAVKESEIKDMDAMFISGSLAKVLPIAYVDNMKKDAHNEMLRNIIDRYNQMVDECIEDNRL